MYTDVSCAWDVEEFVTRTATAAGRIDVLVNNAVTPTSAPFDGQFQYHTHVKLMARIRTARLVLPETNRRGWGHAVNVAGTTARIVAPLRMTNGVVNAGVANFIKRFANHPARSGVTVNCVHPSSTATERVMQIFEREARKSGTSVDAVVAEHTGDNALERLVRPEDQAAAVLLFFARR